MDKKIDIISLNKKAWNNVAEKFNDSKYDTINPLVDYFCDALPEQGFILDLGSGTGIPFAKLFVERGFDYLGIDISSEMVRIARKNVPLANFKELSMTDLNFDKKFDGIFSSYSMLLLSPELLKEVTQRIVNSLKQDGLFYISLNEPPVKDADLDKDVFCEIMGEAMYSRAYTEDEIINAFSPLGLKCLKIHREILSTEEFGIEHMMVLVFKKTL
ncbi:MAG: class I SAM-dependent DNA methyltransferase [Promethearchaeota archaeon]|jgi:SAM-dependent methyltransferase